MSKVQLFCAQTGLARWARLVLSIALIAGLFWALPTPSAADTAADEEAAWKQASRTGDPRLLTAFLNDFPESEHYITALERVTEIINGMNQARAALKDNPPQFSKPMRGISDELNGRSIESMLKIQPTFPPILGLPDRTWKNRACTACHKWKKENLCTQAQTYQFRDKPDFPHPHGPQFHVALKIWGENGCL